MTSQKSNELILDISAAWALAEVLRHRAPCAPDCEYCANTGGDRAYVGYKLAAKVQRALLRLQEQQGVDTPIEIDEREAWMIYRYLPPTAYNGARELLLQVFKIIANHMITTELPSWMRGVNLD